MAFGVGVVGIGVIGVVLGCGWSRVFRFCVGVCLGIGDVESYVFWIEWAVFGEMVFLCVELVGFLLRFGVLLVLILWG